MLACIVQTQWLKIVENVYLEVFPHPPCSPDLAIYDSFCFGPLPQEPSIASRKEMEKMYKTCSSFNQKYKRISRVKGQTYNCGMILCQK